MRNAWLRALARRLSMGELSGRYLTTFGDMASLRDVLIQISKDIAIARGRAEHRAHVRSRRVLAGALAAGLLFLAVMPTRANVVATTGWPRPGGAWASVTDSLVAAVNGKLLRLGQSEARFTMPLSGAELAALVLASRSTMRVSVLDRIEARADSMLQIRGFLPGGGRLVMRGDVRVRRSGVGEFRLSMISLNGATMPVALYATPEDGSSGREANAPRFRFDLPRFVRAIRVTGGRAFVVPESTR